MRHFILTSALSLFFIAGFPPPVLSAPSAQCVVLLHGLARSSSSMSTLAAALESEGYHVANIGYPSTVNPIAELAEMAVPAGLQDCAQAQATPVNFVTHSMGGILVRQYLKRHPGQAVGRVVMLGPPNQGSEVVDTLRDLPGFELLNGPAGRQLGTEKDAVPAQLGPVDFPLGVIAGTRTINLILSSILPGPNDGKVSVASTQVEGMEDFITLAVTHPLMMRNKEVISQVTHFLQHGRFNTPEPSPLEDQ